MSEDIQTMQAEEVQTVPYTMSVPKESKEIIDAQTKILQHFVAGGSLEGAAAMLPDVMKAVDDFKKVPAELKSKYNDEAAGYLVHKEWEALKGGPEN